MIYLILFLSVISAILYRAGGMSKDVKHWIPKWLRQSWVRDWLCPACALLPAFILHPSWWFIVAYGALRGAFSTYWDGLSKDGEGNFWFAGFMCGIAGFPLLFCGFAWWLLLIRAMAIAITWGAWCAIFSNDFTEEYGRGFLVSFATKILFLIP